LPTSPQMRDQEPSGSFVRSVETRRVALQFSVATSVVAL
jgi:hypothetical protein